MGGRGRRARAADPRAHPDAPARGRPARGDPERLPPVRRDAAARRRRDGPQPDPDRDDRVLRARVRAREGRPRLLSRSAPPLRARRRAAREAGADEPALERRAGDGGATGVAAHPPHAPRGRRRANRRDRQRPRHPRGAPRARVGGLLQLEAGRHGPRASRRRAASPRSTGAAWPSTRTSARGPTSCSACRSPGPRASAPRSDREIGGNFRHGRRVWRILDSR